jgi:hypothetical protein
LFRSARPWNHGSWTRGVTSRPPTPGPPARNVIRIERVVNMVIQQGNTGSTRTVRLPIDALRGLRS